jgi:8-oxo-dGTP pyrophosphatase MutT (NUDIX family)
VNDKNQVLVVQEKNGPILSIWKMPGGRLDPGEEVHEAAIREVFEETGIKTEFQSLLCFRSSQNGFHGKLVTRSSTFDLCTIYALVAKSIQLCFVYQWGSLFRLQIEAPYRNHQKARRRDC